jgi:hypothetical protein
MQNIALESNLITFSTVLSEVERLRAGRFCGLTRAFELAKVVSLECMTKLESPHLYITAEVQAKVALKFPEFEPLLLGWPDWVRNCFSGGLWGTRWCTAGSVWREFVNYTIEVLSTDTNFAEAVATSPDYKSHWKQNHLFGSSALLAKIPHWIIPSEEELDEIEEVVDPCHPEGFLEPVKWRYSAAAAAIFFLKSLRPGIRLRIRNILLHEDRESVAFPESHVLGLIPFCKENPRLRVDRRVNLWRNVLPSGDYTPLK